MDIPKGMLNVPVTVLFIDETMDQVSIRESEAGEDCDYVMNILVSSIQFNKEDVLVICGDCIVVDFPGHETSVSIHPFTFSEPVTKPRRLSKDVVMLYALLALMIISFFLVQLTGVGIFVGVAGGLGIGRWIEQNPNFS